MEQTLVIVKPDGVKKRLIGECINRIEKKGLRIKSVKSGMLSLAKANILYKHIKKNYPRVFKDLVAFMTGGMVVFMIVEGRGAVNKVRKICGPTDPSKAPKGTIRGDFGTGNMKRLSKKGKAVRNIIHASGTLAEAKKEIMLFF